jgi:uncharacterized protein YndB with AHSA1/START domain
MPRRWGHGGSTKAAAQAAAAAARPAPAAPVPRRPDGPPAPPVEVVVEVAAPPVQVIAWFLDPAKWVRFQGRVAHLEPRPGGPIRVELGDGVVVTGHYLEVEALKVSFTWGRPGDVAMPTEGSTVTVTAAPLAIGGTELSLRHEGLGDAGIADAHRSGWRYHLVRLAVAAGGATGDTERVELFLAAATEADGAARRGLLERTCASTIQVADPVGQVSGIGPLSDFLGRGAIAAPTRRLLRSGDVRRVGAILRCPYAAVERKLAGEATVEEGEIVGALDAGGKFTAVSLF